MRDLNDDFESQLTVISAEQVLQDERLFTLEENEKGKIGFSLNFVPVNVAFFQILVLPSTAATFATLTEQQATDVDLNLAIVAIEDSVSTVNDSLTTVELRVENHGTRLASLENTTAVLDGRIRRLELSGKFN